MRTPPPSAFDPRPITTHVTKLMTEPVLSPARKKAIRTIAKRRNISPRDAQFVQARAIAQSRVRNQKS